MTPIQRINLEIALVALIHLNESFDPDDWCGDVSMLDKSQEGIDTLCNALKEVSFDKEEPAPVPLLRVDEILEVMRDGNNCNYNDESEHIDFARVIEQAVRQKAGL